MDKILGDFLIWLQVSIKNNRKVYGYGAAAKASTILNAIPIETDLLLAIGDMSSEKQQRFMPPRSTRIISPNMLFSEEPTDIVIFPWNIKSEIASYLRSNLGRGVRLWCAVPNMHEVDSQC